MKANTSVKDRPEPEIDSTIRLQYGKEFAEKHLKMRIFMQQIDEKYEREEDGKYVYPSQFYNLNNPAYTDALSFQDDFPFDDQVRSELYEAARETFGLDKPS